MSPEPSESADESAPKVFISYRREETAAYAGRLYDAMAPRFGDSNVFMDVDLEPGIDFVKRITAAVGSCHVLIVVMGPRWATVEDEDGVRIAKPGDFVRLEVATALQRSDVTVIPVLVGGAQMPAPDELPEDIAPITRRNALELSDTRWRYDVGRLTRTLDQLLAEMTATHREHAADGEAAGPAETAGAPARAPGAAPSRRRLVAGILALAAAGALAVLGVVVLGGGSGGGGGDSGVVTSGGIQFEPFTGAQHFTVDMPVGWRKATVEEPLEGGVERTQLQSLDAKRSLHIKRGPQGSPQKLADKVLDDARANPGFQNPQQESRTIGGREAQEFGYEFDQPGVGPVTVVNYAFNAGGFGWQTRASVPTSDTSAEVANDIAAEAVKTLQPR